MRTRIVSKTTASGNMELGVIEPRHRLRAVGTPNFQTYSAENSLASLPRGCLAGETRACCIFFFSKRLCAALPRFESHTS